MICRLYSTFYVYCVSVSHSLSSSVAASGGSAYVYQMAAALLRNPTGQVLLAAWIAALAGLIAWYLI